MGDILEAAFKPRSSSNWTIGAQLERGAPLIARVGRTIRPTRKIRAVQRAYTRVRDTRVRTWREMNRLTRHELRTRVVVNNGARTNLGVNASNNEAAIVS